VRNPLMRWIWMRLHWRAMSWRIVGSSMRPFSWASSMICSSGFWNPRCDVVAG